MLTRLYKLPLLVLLFLCSPALAADALIPVNFSGVYALSFAGIPFGRMQVGVQVQPQSYRVETSIRTEGVAQLLARHSSDSWVEAKGAEPEKMDLSYETHTMTRNKKRDISLQRRKGVMVKESVVPADNRESRPAVAQASKQPAYDPLSVVVKLRDVVARWRDGGPNETTFRLYDGRRLTEARVKIEGERLIHDRPVIATSIRRKPLDGFTQKELSQYSPNEPPLNVYFSADDKLIPAHLEIPFTFGTLSAELQ